MMKPIQFNLDLFIVCLRRSMYARQILVRVSSLFRAEHTHAAISVKFIITIFLIYI